MRFTHGRAWFGHLRRPAGRGKVLHMVDGRNEAMFWARLETQFSQTELADALGVSRETINAIECARSTPSVTLAIAVARALSSDVETLFGGTR